MTPTTGAPLDARTQVMIRSSASTRSTRARCPANEAKPMTEQLGRCSAKSRHPGGGGTFRECHDWIAQRAVGIDAITKRSPLAEAFALRSYAHNPLRRSFRVGDRVIR